LILLYIIFDIAIWSTTPQTYTITKTKSAVLCIKMQNQN